MESVCAVVLVGGDVRGHAVNGEGGVLDAVGIAAGDSAVVGMLAVDAVVACVVPAVWLGARSACQRCRKKAENGKR